LRTFAKISMAQKGETRNPLPPTREGELPDPNTIGIFDETAQAQAAQ
jgi:hypothetical protein